MPSVLEGEEGVGRKPEVVNDFKFSCSLDNSEIPIDPALLGNKGARLMEMVRLGLPVPPGCLFFTDAWRAFNQEGKLPGNVWQETLRQITLLEEKTGMKFTDKDNPLIVSVRSGAPHSMPGLLTTVLNVGLNDETVLGLANRLGDVWSAWDSYRRGIESFATAVYGTDSRVFEQILEQARKDYGVSTDQKLPVEALKEVVEKYKGLFDFPQDPQTQLRAAFEGVLRSWNTPEASDYRRKMGIPDNEGMATTIERMVYGNRAIEFSGSGVYFTRDPQGGERPKVAFLLGAQGPDIVGPEANHYLTEVGTLPDVFRDEFLAIGQTLEEYYNHPQEIEFVYDGKRLWALQTRDSHLSPLATLRSLYEFAHRDTVGPKDIVRRFARELLVDGLLYPGLDPQEVEKAKKEGRFLGTGIPISSGVGIGEVVTSLPEARELASQNIPVVLAVERLSPKDLVNLPEGIKGIATRFGGAGSHIAEILRALGLPVIFGVEVDKLRPGMEITLDGTSGEIFMGKIPLAKEPPLPSELAAFLKEYQELLKHNPWFAASYPAESQFSWDTLGRGVETVVKSVQEKWQSTKAQTIEIIARMFPPEARMEYLVFPKEQIEVIRATFYQFLDEKHEVSLRTCHNPLRAARAPWQRIVTSEEIDLFLNNRDFPSKYGGYPRWQDDQTLTEVVVGRIPKGKLNPELAKQHCVFTVSCVGKTVIVQIIPHTHHLRDLEQVNPNQIITITAGIDPYSPTGLSRVILYHSGEKLKDDAGARRFADLVSKTVLEEWWQPPFALPHRLAALTKVAGLDTLEGQAGISPNGESWCLVYGMKKRRG